MQELQPYEKHNYKLSDEDKKNILLEYKLYRNKTTQENICKKYNISRNTIYNIVNSYSKKEQQEIIDASIKEYKQNFTKKSHAIINKALERINDKLEQDQNINISQLSTTLGILYDKTRLEDNLSTSNNSININIKIE